MSLLNQDEILELIEAGVVTGANPDNVNGSSLDVTLGAVLYVEKAPEIGHNMLPCLMADVDMLNKTCNHLREWEMQEAGYPLAPGEFVLAHTQEIFHLPLDISIEYKLKSTMARNGLDHANAGWGDPGWNNSALTLEFKNQLQWHNIILRPGDKCGQIVFFRHKPVRKDRSYAVRGQYNGHTGVMPGRGLR